LRAKLGPENESLIGTVRNVGYRFVVPPVDRGASETADAAGAADEEPAVSD
jgi:DNA-binding winged helix-turn-helix (wHTH) protein